MATVKTMIGAKLLIKIGNGATPTEIFSHPCMFNADRGISFTSDTQESVVPDCASPESPGWKEIVKDGLSMTVTCGGLLHTTDFEEWFNWASGDTAKNVEVQLNIAGADGGGKLTGKVKVTAFSISGSRKDNVVVDATITSHGPMVWVDGA
jgi:hypothetical protein